MSARRRRRRHRLAGFLEVEDGSFGGEAFEDVDEDGVGFGDVEADVGDVVGDEGVHHGEDGAFDDLEVYGRGECLRGLGYHGSKDRERG